jgi:translation elongation factor EF-1alpha
MSKLMNEIKEEIKFAKTTGMPVFVMGMNKVMDIVEEHEQKEQQILSKLKDYIQERIEYNKGLVGYDDHSTTLEAILEKMEELEA